MKRAVILMLAGGSALWLMGSTLTAGERWDRWRRRDALLLAAIRARQFDQARALLDEGADPNAAERAEYSSRGSTCLMLTVREGDLPFVRELLRRGANPNGKDYLDQAPLWYVENDREDIARVLVQNGAVMEARTAWGWGFVNECVITGQPKVLRFALDHGCDPNERADDGVTALQSALKLKNRRATAILREYGAK